MKIDKEMVEYVAKLSQIELNDEQSALMQSELNKILQYMEILKAVETDNIEPQSSVFSMTNVVRQDIAGEHFDKELLLKNAPERTEETFVVPKAVKV